MGDIIDVIKRLQQTGRVEQKLRDQVLHYQATMNTLERRVLRMSDDMRDVATLFHEIFHRCVFYIDQGERSDAVRNKQKQREAYLQELFEAHGLSSVDVDKCEETDG